jgi:aminoglycoside phosphotransferase
LPPKPTKGHEPLSSDDELWDEMSAVLSHVPQEVPLKLRKRMPTAAPYTFTHGNLTDVNIMVGNGHLVGMIGRETLGISLRGESLLSCR